MDIIDQFKTLDLNAIEDGTKTAAKAAAVAFDSLCDSLQEAVDNGSDDLPDRATMTVGSDAPFDVEITVAFVPKER